MMIGGKMNQAQINGVSILLTLKMEDIFIISLIQEQNLYEVILFLAMEQTVLQLKSKLLKY